MDGITIITFELSINEWYSKLKKKCKTMNCLMFIWFDSIHKYTICYKKAEYKLNIISWINWIRRIKTKKRMESTALNIISTEFVTRFSRLLNKSNKWKIISYAELKEFHSVSTQNSVDFSK